MNKLHACPSAARRQTRKSGAFGGRQPAGLIDLGRPRPGAAGILGGLVLEKGSILDVAQGTAALIVLGGTLGGRSHNRRVAVVLFTQEGPKFEPAPNAKEKA